MIRYVTKNIVVRIRRECEECRSPTLSGWPKSLYETPFGTGKLRSSDRDCGARALTPAIIATLALIYRQHGHLWALWTRTIPLGAD